MIEICDDGNETYHTISSASGQHSTVYGKLRTAATPSTVVLSHMKPSVGGFMTRGFGLSSRTIHLGSATKVVTVGLGSFFNFFEYVGCSCQLSRHQFLHKTFNRPRP
jgi:hypothetical protein